jgi:hypothetical protein
MEISRSAVGIVAIACVIAGAGSTYLATRAHRPSPATEHPIAGPFPEGLPVTVEHTEAVVTEPETPAPPPAPAPRPARRQVVQQARVEIPAPSTSNPVSSREPAVQVASPAPVPIEPAAITPNEPSRWVAPVPLYHELVVAADSVIGLRIETAVTSETARVEDEVVARVMRDVRVGDRVAIPAGSRAEGEVTFVERGGRLRERARLGVRFTSIVLADGTRVPMSTEAVYREGDAPGAESAAKIGGGAIGGAIIGGILGGAKGAAIGGSAGAGAGATAVLVGGRNEATLPADSQITVRLEQPVTVIVEN